MSPLIAHIQCQAHTETSSPPAAWHRGSESVFWEGTIVPDAILAHYVDHFSSSSRNFFVIEEGLREAKDTPSLLEGKELPESVPVSRDWPGPGQMCRVQRTVVLKRAFFKKEHVPWILKKELDSDKPGMWKRAGNEVGRLHKTLWWACTSRLAGANDMCKQTMAGTVRKSDRGQI